MSANDQSLDATLKELLKESPSETLEESPTSEEDTSTLEKPKRTRRTKAQIEADKKAAEEAAAKEVENTEKSTEDIPEEAAEQFQGAAESDTEIESDKPEDLLETEEDQKEDVVEESTESTETPDEVPATEILEPEVIEETAEDRLPDVVEPKELPKARRPVIPGEVYDAFKEKETKANPNSIIGKSCILFNSTPMYRAPHVSMRIKPYRGHVTVLENPKGGFVKVQFLRQGFGLCEGFVSSEVITSILAGDENERGNKDN